MMHTAWNDFSGHSRLPVFNLSMDKFCDFICIANDLLAAKILYFILQKDDCQV